MINKIINIDVDYEAMGVEKSPRQTTLTTYILEQENIALSKIKKRPAVIVCPGGGYSDTSPREAEPIAMKYCSAGFHSFVLDYSVAPAGFPAAVCELSKAVVYVKSIADEYSIDKDKIFVVGFSAGGHLVASLGVHFNHPDVKKFADVDGVENKPAGIILGYPVITAEDGKTHQGTINNFCAGREELRELASLEKYVTPETPTTFIWHTFADAGVPVISTLRFAAALEENGVKFEMHVYPDGPHGLSLGNWITDSYNYADLPSTPVENWIDMSIRWVTDMMRGYTF